MSREILFRGKRKNGQWVYGSLVVSENINPAIYYESKGGLVKRLDWCYVKPETIGQYTGLKDEEGNKIFEGDIVHLKGDGYGGAKIGKDYYRVVTFHEGSFCLSIEDGVHYPVHTPIYEHSDSHNIVNWDVVGNITDNPRINEVKRMKNIYTLCYTIEEADALGHFIMGKGYEGVQNDSYRYCRMEMEWAFKRNARHSRNYIFVGVNGYQLVVGMNKREMRKKGSYKYIEKKRVFGNLLSKEYEEVNVFR